MDACFIRLFLIVFFLRQLVVLFCQHCRMPWQTASFCAWYVGRRMMANSLWASWLAAQWRSCTALLSLVCPESFLAFL